MPQADREIDAMAEAYHALASISPEARLRAMGWLDARLQWEHTAGRQIEDESVASLFPLDLSGEIMALRACIDAGTQDGVFSIAAVAFGYERAVKANAAWERLLKGRTFHMTDLNARQGEFEGIGVDEVHDIMVGTIAIIRKHASYAVAVSCDATMIADSLPILTAKHADTEAMLSAFKSAYGFMCNFAMSALGRRANNNRPGRQISYVFERGDEGQSGLRRFLAFLGDEPHHRLFLDGYSLDRETVADKKSIEGIFHSSDLLAWEWARHVGRHRRKKPMRKSLAELARHHAAASDEYGITLSAGRPFFCRHLSRERLDAYLKFFRENLSATTVEEARAAFDRYREIYPEPGADESLGPCVEEHRSDERQPSSLPLAVDVLARVLQTSEASRLGEDQRRRIRHRAARQKYEAERHPHLARASRLFRGFLRAFKAPHP